MNELERHVLEYIGENPDSPDVFTDDSTGMAQIRDSLNDAIEEVAALTGGWTRTVYLPLRASTYFYRLTFDKDTFGYVINAWSLGQRRRLEQKDAQAFDAYNPRWLEQTGNPEFYAQIGLDVLAVLPAPSSSTGQIELECVVIPARYTEGTDRVWLKRDWQYAVEHYAVSEYWASRGDAKSAQEHHVIYLKHMGLMGVAPSVAERRWGYKTTKDAAPDANPR
jgi:hypothetical protein